MRNQVKTERSLYTSIFELNDHKDDKKITWPGWLAIHIIFHGADVHFCLSKFSSIEYHRDNTKEITDLRRVYNNNLAISMIPSFNKCNITNSLSLSLSNLGVKLEGQLVNLVHPQPVTIRQNKKSI